MTAAARQGGKPVSERTATFFRSTGEKSGSSSKGDGVLTQLLFAGIAGHILWSWISMKLRNRNRRQDE